MTDTKRILVISLSDLARDPRVNRQVRWLNKQYEVVCAGLGDPRVEGVTFVQLRHGPQPLIKKPLAAAQLLLGRFEPYYRAQRWIVGASEALGATAFDAVVANDPDTLPFTLSLRGHPPVIFDAHEYSPRQSQELLFRAFFRRYADYLCTTYMPRAAASCTVCEGIAGEYALHVGVHPAVVWSAPDYEKLEPSAPTSDGLIRMVHHGGASRQRRLELMIELMTHLDERFTLDLLLVPGSMSYIGELKQRAAGNPRIRFLDPVPMRELPRFTNAYSVGLFLLPPTNFNYAHALPNKFFEFIQARLAIAIGPSPEMARIVGEHGLGVVADDFTPASLADKLNALTDDDLARYKANCHRVASQYCAETAMGRWMQIVRDVLARRDPSVAPAASNVAAAQAEGTPP